ncbi:probable sodium-coupled neutral amino acid transporter 6 isoform X2 [Asparagus officinalis]|uniref:probable sodium-coupled neutral amino acid transporter 6 isoform X2 n=1 Tax=Asparagus officinalis TaxID=4686 RepID=UPI00098E4CDE|nr:probable sodium-coupled neutral amino acid transporter 6 isoform X2 [Asparagus officinalis]
MTTGSLQPVRNKNRARRDKQIANETTPLLPSKHEGSSEFHEFNGASFSGAVFNLSTTIIGAGIMALPATMKVLGLVPGIVMIIFIAFLTEASVEMLIRFSRVEKMTSYGGVMGDAFGRIGRMLLQICVVINNVGIMVVYMIIIDSLRYTSALSVALAAVFVVVTAAIAIVKLVSGSVQMPRLFPEITDLSSVWNLFTAVPVLVTAFICHYNVHSVDNELDDSSLIQPIVRTSLALCSTVYIATSFFSYLLFGDSTLDDVLTNFDSDLGIPYSSLLNDIVRVSYVLHLMLVFPIIFFALRLNFDGLLFPSARPISSDNRRFAFVTLLLLSFVFLAANFIPSIWDAFQFTGSTATVCIGFIFPAAITLRDAHAIASNRDKILSSFMIVLAVVSSGVAIYSDVFAIFQRSKPAPKY